MQALSLQEILKVILRNNSDFLKFPQLCLLHNGIQHSIFVGLELFSCWASHLCRYERKNFPCINFWFLMFRGEKVFFFDKKLFHLILMMPPFHHQIRQKSVKKLRKNPPKNNFSNPTEYEADHIGLLQKIKYAKPRIIPSKKCSRLCKASR